MTITIRDKLLIWHPFTQHETSPDLIAVTKALGSYIYDAHGKSYLDLISSWWVNIHGHSHPEIAKQIYQQACRLEHVIFAGFTHEPAVNLCENLSEILPKNLTKFFFSDNGSTAVEIAIKMSYQYWRNLKKSYRNMFLSFDGGYHGDTVGAMAVGLNSGFHNQFADLCFKVLSIPYPETWENDQDVLIKEKAALNKLNEYLTQYNNKIAAIILEPLIQGASGMRICRPSFLEKIISIVKKQNILVIFDEVMTGFGRTGSNFALDQLNIAPDFLCLAKGLTGGFLPLALTVTSENIFNAFLGGEFNLALAHGHSYTANPVACSAAITSLKLLKEDLCQNAILKINQAHQDGMAFLKSHCSLIEKIRIIGTISAFDIKQESKAISNIYKIKEDFLKAGLLLRPLKNTFYILPPYSTTSEDLELAYQKIVMILKKFE
jgi:adenosylmethionine---8-amino-7-oxononanoate aminotransferase